MKTLLKTAGLTIILFALSFMDAHALYKRWTYNGGPNGYDKTWKEVTDNGNTFISCNDPGSTECPTVIASGHQNMNEDIQIRFSEYALLQIGNGNFSGKASDGIHIVYWKSDNNEALNSEITIVGIDEILNY